MAWDFVELPSQIMENWCWERECLDLFARHWQTGEPIPDALSQPLLRARTYRAANAMMRQLGFSAVDLWMHMELDPGAEPDVLPRARERLAEFAAAPLPEDDGMIASFGHLFAHPVGYAAAYYSYKYGPCDPNAATSPVFSNKGAGITGVFGGLSTGLDWTRVGTGEPGDWRRTGDGGRPLRGR